MIKEVIVVEGKQDIAAIKRAVDAECIATGGFTLGPLILHRIEQAYQKRGLIILTDPDSAGERIRNYLKERFPLAKHAFVPRRDATANQDVGIEQASPEAIRAALAKIRYLTWQPREEFLQQDLLQNRLSGGPDAAERRAVLGEMLGIGYANAKSFLYRLNHYGVSREEFSRAVAQMEAGPI
ncbi:ribonuclease m5 [Lucifera butyrica]|uniref:Ribonuclease M5 n=1 Tax=Lucifera butyrica TaxID=1351585 RepID=A0A498R5Z3_9FIRM|nr:ribonuclease M5 [Lucifera butyrica]VBB06579.1 ribonuclease m5 [Lucifera butyrica]